MRTLRSIPMVLSLVTVACGGGSTPAQTTTPTKGDVSADRTPAQHKLAHFRSADGMMGLTLDRTGDKAKLQIDGQKDIVELTMESERSKWNGTLMGFFFVAPDGKRPIFIDEGGGITYLSGNDHISLLFDKDVSALGPATVRGTYVPPTPVYKIAIDRLKPLAVRTKFSQFQSQDAANLAKVAEAIGLATKDMFVHYTTHGDTSASAYHRIVPQSFEGIGFGGVGWRADGKWDPKAKGLAKYGGIDQGFSHVDTPQGNHMQVVVLDGYKPALADGTPGLVWETTDTGAVFVTLDGARWEVGLQNSDKGENIEAGAGAPTSWPAPAQDALLTVSDVSSLVKAGALPQKNIDDLLALDQEWTQCAAKSWEPAKKKIEAAHEQRDLLSEAENQEYVRKARTSCVATIKKQEAILLKLVETRVKERQALVEKAKTRI